MNLGQGWAALCRAGLGLLLVAAFSCEGKQRYYAVQSLRGDGGVVTADNSQAGGTSASDDALELAQLGDACSESRSCASGYCVDGVCCDGACTELCATCAAPGSQGTCSPAASDVQCEAVACPGSTECRGRDQTGVALNCEAVGKCRSSLMCAPLDQPQGTACGAGGAGQCDGKGACIVPDKVALGAACASDDECAEGNCVVGPAGSGICCDAPCDGLCQQCGADGRCDLAPASDPRCEIIACPADNACRDYPDALTVNLCRGFGQCLSAQDCTFTALRPAVSCDCDPTGNCTLRRGQRCDTSDQCAEGGACVNDVAGQAICCAQACGAGLSCSTDGSGCVECEGSSVTCEGVTATRCVDGLFSPANCANGCTPGVGCNAQAPVGFSCAASTCVAGAVCQNDAAGARRCCVRDCAAEGKQCSTEGSCVCPPGQTTNGSSCALQRGDPCGAGNAQCGPGLSCVDGVCCNEACSGACESCNLPGSVGVCSFASGDTRGCASGEQCVARGDCRGGLSARCAQAGDCVSNSCEPLLGVSGQNVCCAAACNAPREFCTSDGSRCVQCQTNAECSNGCNVAQGVCNPPRALGEACNVAQQCGSGVCLPDVSNAQVNRCCPACAAGQLCSAQGACQNPPLGAGGRCQSDGQCGSGLFCRDGVCCTSACDGACQSCGGNGVCNVTQASDSQRCGAVTCTQQSNACRTVTPPAAGQCAGLGQCSGSAQCTVQLRPMGTTCNGNGQCDGTGSCVLPVLSGNGQACTAASQCSSGNCELSQLNPSQGICCIQSCADGQYCKVVSVNAHQCVECATNADCPTGCNTTTGACNALRGNGEACTNRDECASNGDCVLHFADADNDDYAAVGAVQSRFCVSGSFNMPGQTTRQPGSITATDCFEGNASVHPGQTAGFTTAAPDPNRAHLPFDYDCNGTETSPNTVQNALQDCSNASLGVCNSRGSWIQDGVTPGAIGVPACGSVGYISGCADIGGVCQGVAGGLLTRACR